MGTKFCSEIRKEGKLLADLSANRSIILRVMWNCVEGMEWKFMRFLYMAQSVAAGFCVCCDGSSGFCTCT